MIFSKNGEMFIRNGCINCEKHPECAACCKRKNPVTGKARLIRATPIDVFRMAKKLHMKPKDFLSKYCIPTGRIEYYLKTEGNDGTCVLLKKGKCMVHGAAPLSCKCFPLGITEDGFREVADPWGEEYRPKAIKVIDYLNKMTGCQYEEDNNAKNAFIQLCEMYDILFPDNKNDHILRQSLYNESTSEKEINCKIALLLLNWMKAG